MSSNNNMLITLFGLSVLIFAFQKYSITDTVEGFVDYPRTIKVERVAMSPRTGDVVNVQGQYQAMLQPRDWSGNTGYDALVKYNMPDQGKLGTSQGSLNFASMVSSNKCTEGYCNGCNSAGCSAGNSMMNDTTKSSNLLPSSFASANYKQQYNKLNFNSSTDLLPVTGMGAQTSNALGEVATQPIIYDRYVYANQRSRLYAQGDPIRGDLPIVPIAQGWFSPNVNPNIDLRDGATMAIGGTNNDTAKELMALRSAAAGGLLDVGAGVNYAVQQSVYTGAAGQDVRVTAFP